MAYKGERYQQVPTLWHLGVGYPCRVVRRRRVLNERTGRRVWRQVSVSHDVLTLASADRWWRLREQGKARVRRDVNLEAAIGFGILPRPARAQWAGLPPGYRFIIDPARPGEIIVQRPDARERRDRGDGNDILYPAAL